MRLTDADKLQLRINLVGTNKFGMLDEDIRKFVDENPTVDAVPVTRCKNCKDFHRNDENDPYCANKRGLDDPVPDGFCNYGKPREECENGRNDQV